MNKRQAKKAIKTGRKPAIKSESKTWQKQFLSGKFPKNTTTAILAKYTNPTKGTPNKRALRSRRAREEYNKALEKFNRERMTVKKQSERDRAIREKQLANVAANVAPEAAEKAKSEHAHMLDVVTTVKDDISSRAKYEAYKELQMVGVDVNGISADDLAAFIAKAYNELQDSLPSYARAKKPGYEDRLDNEFINALSSILKDINSTDLKDISEAITAKGKGQKEYTRYLRNLKRRQARSSRRRR